MLLNEMWTRKMIKRKIVKSLFSSHATRRSRSTAHSTHNVSSNSPLQSALQARSCIFVNWFISSFWNVLAKKPSFGKRAIAIGLQNAAMQRINENIRSMCFWQAALPAEFDRGQLLTSSIDMLWSLVLPVIAVSAPQFSSCGSICTSITSWPSRESSVRFTLVWKGAISPLPTLFLLLLFVTLLLRCECLGLFRLLLVELRLLCDLLLRSDFTDSVSILELLCPGFAHAAESLGRIFFRFVNFLWFHNGG